MASMQPDVLIVGAGPTGLAAALMLAHRRIAVRIIDTAEAPATTSKALAVNSRTLEVLQGTGVAEQIVAEGWPVQGATLHEGGHDVLAFDLPPAEGAYPAMTVLPQARTEALLAKALAARGVTVERGVTFQSLSQDLAEVKATLAHADGRSEQVTSRLLLGADGARSATRTALALDFEGSSLPEPWQLWDIAMACSLDAYRAHILFEPDGFIFVLRLAGDCWRVIGNTRDPLATLRRYGTLAAVSWESQFHIGHRVASRTGVGRVARQRRGAYPFADRCARHEPGHRRCLRLRRLRRRCAGRRHGAHERLRQLATPCTSRWCAASARSRAWCTGRPPWLRRRIWNPLGPADKGRGIEAPPQRVWLVCATALIIIASEPSEGMHRLALSLQGRMLRAECRRPRLSDVAHRSHR